MILPHQRVPRVFTSTRRAFLTGGAALAAYHLLAGRRARAAHATTLLADQLFYIDSSAGSDVTGDGLTRATAWQTPQFARNWVYRNVDVNLFRVTFFLCGQTNPLTAPYSGVISAFPFLGQPPDYGENWQGEMSGAVRATLVISSTTGCFHSAEGAQPYVYDVMTKSSGGAQNFKAPFNGKMFLYNVKSLGAPGAAIVEAGPVLGRINIDSAWSVDCAGNAGTALVNAWDDGSISAPAGCTLVNTPSFSFSTAAVSARGRIEYRGTISGAATGKCWTTQSDGMLLTGFSNPDNRFPGTIAGSSLDGTGYRL